MKKLCLGLLFVGSMFSVPSAFASIESQATAATQIWAGCLIQNVRKYSSLTTESAETVVTAAFGECSHNESKVRLAILPMHMRKYIGVAKSTESMVAMAERDTDMTFGNLRESYWGKMIGLVLEERSTASSKSDAGQ